MSEKVCIRYVGPLKALYTLPPDRPVHSDTNSASLGSILAMHQLRATTISLTFPPLSIARYSLIQLSEQGRQWRERKCPIFGTAAKRRFELRITCLRVRILPVNYRAYSSTISCPAHLSPQHPLDAPFQPRHPLPQLRHIRTPFQILAKFRSRIFQLDVHLACNLRATRKSAIQSNINAKLQTLKTRDNFALYKIGDIIRGQDYKRFSSMSRCSTHNLWSEMT